MASSDHIVLLDFLGSPFGMRVRLALAAKGIEYQIEEEDSTQSKSSLLLKLDTVHKKIPVLIHNGKPICESLIIVAYIDEKEFIDRIKLLEGELKSNPYFGGETLDFLDIAFLPLYYWFHTFETFGKFSIEAECPKLAAWGKRYGGGIRVRLSTSRSSAT
ncbi:putative glutathione S-transferase [Vitis vinifera]|uniref:Glutathione S-transferase n=1 Tax=Vitis vinifera TaxID=29760 RepID=A0A438IP16_VITVI|nr:putative glutathione S-transferase [Vitis vinifera]